MTADPAREARMAEARAALAGYDAALAADPARAEAWAGRALALQALGEIQAAQESCARAAALRPHNPALHHVHAQVLAAAGRPEAALEAFGRALALSPAPEARLARADLLMSLGRARDALADYDQVLAASPDTARAWSNRGVALQALDRPDEAVRSFDRALAHAPGFVDALANRGLALRETGRLDAAIASLGAAAALAPDNPAVLCNLGVSQLLAGDLAPGFAGHEQRWRLEPNRSEARAFDAPLWLDQGDIAGKTLLLHAEQGFGDTIQFCRYAALATERGARVVLEVQPALIPVMRSLAGVATLVAAGEPLPAFDLHCPLMSLPLAFGTTLETIPAAPAYLEAPPERAAHWAGAIPASGQPRVGLVWFGKPTHGNDRNRSLPLARFLAALPPGIDLFSLHDRIRPEDEPALAARPDIRRFDEAIRDFGDTAALAARMDIVVSVDTSAAHLAAALGRPTWLLLPFSPDWRWLLGRGDSPWYPTMRLFRQPAIGDWDGALADVREQLELNQ